MKKKSVNQKQTVLALAALCVVFAVFAAAYFALRPQGAAGSKDIMVEIVTAASGSKTVEIKTDAEFLRQALEEKDLIQGDESEFGLFVKTVDGVTADDSRQEWWCFTKDGGQLMSGVDFIPIADGEHYEITLTIGY